MLADKLDAEIARLDGLLYRRGIFFEDEMGMHTAYTNVRQWLKDDKIETQRIEAEAAEAAEEKRKTAPNYATREMFKNVKTNIPRKEL